MKIGIDVSQLAYENTGVANYLKSLTETLLKIDQKNEYILFFSSLRRKFPIANFYNSNFKLKTFRFPPILLDFLWNKLHILPIENLIGNVDIFITSDWVEPPAKKARKATIIYDLIVYKYPEESHNQFSFNWKNLLIKPNIVASQKRKLKWVKKETDLIFAISKATKNDIVDILKIPEEKIEIIYPGV